MTKIYLQRERRPTKLTRRRRRKRREGIAKMSSSKPIVTTTAIEYLFRSKGVNKARKKEKNLTIKEYLCVHLVYITGSLL